MPFASVERFSGSPQTPCCDYNYALPRWLCRFNTYKPLSLNILYYIKYKCLLLQVPPHYPYLSKSFMDQGPCVGVNTSLQCSLGWIFSRTTHLKTDDQSRRIPYGNVMSLYNLVYQFYIVCTIYYTRFTRMFSNRFLVLLVYS